MLGDIQIEDCSKLYSVRDGRRPTDRFLGSRTGISRLSSTAFPVSRSVSPSGRNIRTVEISASFWRLSPHGIPSEQNSLGFGARGLGLGSKRPKKITVPPSV